MLSCKPFPKSVLLLILFSVCKGIFVPAQNQAIGTLKMDDGSASRAYNTDALIDMQSNTKGLLLPRVALTATNSPSPLSAFTAAVTREQLKTES